MTTVPVPITIPVQPWLKDHRFNGTIVLAAVETLLLLATEVHDKYPKIDIRVMEDARFLRFLEISPESTSIEALIDCRRTADGSIRAKLLSRVRFKTMTRLLEHGEVVFPAAKKEKTSVIPSEPPEGTVTEISADRIYRELVPFGPAYHTLQENLLLSAQGAWGQLQAPALPETTIMEYLGSPFPLDGALHAACVHGRQSVDFIPFPVGFDRRIVTCATRPGENYQTTIFFIDRTKDQLVYDLEIFDMDGRSCETVTGIRMRKAGGN